MAQSLNARTRLISLVEIMTMYSDEQNILSLDEICEKLKEYGYEVTKRTVLADIKAVNTTPIKMISVNKPKKGYYLAKSFSQAAINLILEAIYSSDMLCEDDMEYITRYLRRNTCLPTLDLIMSTTKNFYSLAPKKEISADALYNLRMAIREKKQVDLTISEIVPGDSFSFAEKLETITVNPVSVAVSCGVLALVFTCADTPEKAEFINMPRIKSASITDNPAAPYSGNLQNATNYFDGRSSTASTITSEWILFKFKLEDIEIIENNFASPIQFRKAQEDGYCTAKVFAVIDKSLIGLLFLLGDRIEIIKPVSLKELMSKKITNII